MLAHIARKYDRDYGHFSTRQNIQYNWPKLEEVPDILADLASVQMHAIQTSGNCIRNITADHFGGIAKDEIVDTFVWCEILRQWSTFHPEFNWLPRKFKIAVNGASVDRAATYVHDIGLHAVKSADGDIGFRVIIGGGLGRTPIVGPVIREFLPWQHLLTYLEAALRVYNRYGRRDNLYKARIKILVKERGADKFREEVEAEWARLKDGPNTLTAEEVKRVEGRFTRPDYQKLPEHDAQVGQLLASNAAFRRWHERNTFPHKVPGYVAVTLSLKPTGVPPGDATSAQMEAVAGMAERYFQNSDGELLLVPQSGALLLHTECGLLAVAPGEIALVPRGMKFKVELPDGGARGYVCENYGAYLRLAERGPVGSDGYANGRDFMTPVAHFVDDDSPGELITKFQGRLFRTELDHCPLDVVAWVGTAVPFKYDLARFNAMNSVTYDHPDPSIFTVLTSPSASAGVANLDFVIFPPRWTVAEHTFRPPWFHRNVMSEFMGLVLGQYDAKKGGFEPGGMSLHNAFVPHGPDAGVFEAASHAPLAPHKLEHTLAFMFESRYVFKLTARALNSPHLQADYAACWRGLARHFDG